MTTVASFAVETRWTIFFSRWTCPCLSGVSSLLTGLLDRIPFAFPFLCRVPPFEHEPFEVQDRQSVPFSSAPFEECAADAPSLERSF